MGAGWTFCAVLRLLALFVSLSEIPNPRLSSRGEGSIYPRKSPRETFLKAIWIPHPAKSAGIRDFRKRLSADGYLPVPPFLLSSVLKGFPQLAKTGLAMQ